MLPARFDTSSPSPCRSLPGCQEPSWLLDTASMTVIGERMLDLQQVLRVFDTKPWAAHLYVTEQCNLDCHYCNEFNNSIQYPALADLKKWMDHVRKLDVMCLGWHGGVPCKH